jgi:hypothetical protein
MNGLYSWTAGEWIWPWVGVAWNVFVAPSRKVILKGLPGLLKFVFLDLNSVFPGGEYVLIWHDIHNSIDGFDEFVDVKHHVGMNVLENNCHGGR